MKNNVFVTSDCHFYHTNIIAYCNRPYATMEEMNSDLISKWNSIVADEDDIYVIGDLCLIGNGHHENKLEKLMTLVSSLNGRKHLIRGNHDYFRDQEYLDAGFEEVVHGILEVNLHNHWWNMCHYQMTSWNNSHRGTYHLFGHEHWPIQYVPDHEFYHSIGWSERKFNVCMDANKFKPINIDKIASILDKRDFNGPCKKN